MGWSLEDVPDCSNRGVFGDCHDDEHLVDCMTLVIAGKCPEGNLPPSHPTEKFTLQFNTQTREYDLIPESGMDQHKIRRQP